MRAKSVIACVALALALSADASARQTDRDIHLAPNAPKDKPVGVAGDDELREFEAAIKPYVEQARKTYPEAKRRFLKGLPERHTFFVTARLRDDAGRFEQVFVAVREIKDGKIRGIIASDVQLVPGYRHGDSYTFPEGDLYDWMVSRPDGTEEGNFVGKFLDNYRPGAAAEATVVEVPAWKNAPVTPERMNQRIEETAVRLQEQAPIPRVVLYDIAYPRDAREYESLDGHAVVLLTSLSQEREELPLRRVYVVAAGGKEVELKLLKLGLSEQSAADVSARTFGRYRADALYLLPLYLRAQAGGLAADFAKNRASMKVADFGTPLPEQVRGLGIKPPAGAGPPAGALEEFIRREYPSFFK